MGDGDADFARVLAVARLYPAVKIRLDANGTLSVDECVRLAQHLADAGVLLEYFEQPVSGLDRLAMARAALAELGVAVAADESVRKATDPFAVARAGAADLLVLKAAPLGGIASALAIARGAGLPWVVSSALESAVGISMGAHLAAAAEPAGVVGSAGAANPAGAVGAAPVSHGVAHGLATGHLLAGDVLDEPPLARDGWLPVRRVHARLERCLRLL